MPSIQSWSLIDSVTSDELIRSIRRRGMLPDSNSTFSDEDLLEMADEELQTYIVPLLLQEAGSEHLVQVKDVAVTAGQTRFLIPDDAAISRLRDLQWVDGQTATSLQYIEPERAADHIDGSSTEGYTFEGDRVILRPGTNSAGTLRFKYYKRPGKLVFKASAGRITNIVGLQAVITPAGLFGSSTTAVVDVNRGRPGFAQLQRSVTVSVNASGSILTFPDAASLTDVVIGDYICNEDEAPFPQVPKELHALLAQRVVVRVLEALGDPKFQTADAVCERLKKTALDFLTPRQDGTGRVIINPYGPGQLTTARRFRR